MIQGERQGADIWKEIPGFGGAYRINFLGTIEHVYKNGTRGIVRPVVKHGRLVIRLTNGGRRREYQVHKLTAAAFLKPTPEGCVLYHINGDRLDPAAGNLAYITRSDLGKKTGAASGRRPVVKKTLTGEPMEYYSSARAAGKANNYCYQAIMDRCNGKLKRPPKDFIFEWAR